MLTAILCSVGLALAGGTIPASMLAGKKPEAAAPAKPAPPAPRPDVPSQTFSALQFGGQNALFTPAFQTRVVANSKALSRALGDVVGSPTFVRPLDGDRYMVYSTRGFVLWTLNFSADGHISGASYEIRDNPGTPPRVAAARDQRDAYGFWSDVGATVATVYAEQQRKRQEEEAFTSAVLARIAANGGYRSSGSGVGARGSIISDEQVRAFESAAASPPAGIDHGARGSAGQGSAGQATAGGASAQASVAGAVAASGSSAARGDTVSAGASTASGGNGPSGGAVANAVAAGSSGGGYGAIVVSDGREERAALEREKARQTAIYDAQAAPALIAQRQEEQQRRDAADAQIEDTVSKLKRRQSPPSNCAPNSGCVSRE